MFLRITQVYIQYHATQIRCVSTCINKQKCVQLVPVTKGSLATYFDFWKETNEAYNIHFVSLELILAPWNALYHFSPGFAPWGSNHRSQSKCIFYKMLQVRQRLMIKAVIEMYAG